jgi:hypothetical protein
MQAERTPALDVAASHLLANISDGVADASVRPMCGIA